jgi:hypothetical protein
MEAQVMDKVASGQVVLQVVWFPHVNIIPLWHSIFICHLGLNNRPIGGCSSETNSHPININNKLKEYAHTETFQVMK